jgi:hypothetical protein
LAASVRDGLTHLDPAYWGSVKFEVVNTMLGDWGPKMEVRLRFKTDDPVADKYRIPETDYKQAPSGFALLLDKAAFKLMGEERFVETRANTLLRTISIMEAKFCKEHRLKPKPAIRASEERALIEQAVGQAREPKRLTRSL